MSLTLRSLEEAKHELEGEKHELQRMHAEELDAMTTNMANISDTLRSVTARLDALCLE